MQRLVQDGADETATGSARTSRTRLEHRSRRCVQTSTLSSGARAGPVGLEQELFVRRDRAVWMISIRNRSRIAAIEHLVETLLVERILPACDDDGGDGVADQVGWRQPL